MNKPPKKVTDIFYETQLWQHFKDIADNEQQLLVDNLIRYASSLLDRIIETFPTYTLHNNQHQLNILNNIAGLLGNRLQELTSLETAMLLLATFYHDIGMVFSENERAGLQNEKDFEIFVKENPSAKLKINNLGELTLDVAEWYCRWAHARRVWVYLEKVDAELIWENISIKEQLGELCLSHNESVDYLMNDIKFDTNFWAEADLRFCGIILRLADILDFDNSRSPEGVFEYLRLDKYESEREKISHNEWKKHLASHGFDFCRPQSNTTSNRRKRNGALQTELIYKASPNHPAVENDIRAFLDIIEIELQKCSMLVKHCSGKWSNFNLPETIDRKNIKSQGYKFGNYKFSLDQFQILNLLMGDALYDSYFIFIRELLQNALDTSRHREFHEHRNGNTNFKIKPIQIFTWIDSNGYRWIRIEDYGMGMTNEIIEKYFLKIGSSYYNSNEFIVKKLDYKVNNGVEFTPISRFGVGILSCFIAGDRVEVNTMSIECDGRKKFPIRLSLKGLHNFFILQTENDKPDTMPIEKGNDFGYRKEPGTSIAVRLKIDQDRVDLDVNEIFDKTLLNPPVSVQNRFTNDIGNYLALTREPWTNNYKEEFKDSDKDIIKTFLDYENIVEVFVDVTLLNLSKSAHSCNLKGQILLIGLEINDEELKKRLVIKGLTYSKHQLTAEFTRRDKNNLNKPSIKLDISYVLDRISIFNHQIMLKLLSNRLVISYNGIIIQLNKGDLDLRFDNPLLAFGIIELQDNLRPEINIARDKITNVSWNLWSEINYAIVSELSSTKYFNGLKKHFFDAYIKGFLYKDALTDILITSNKFWATQKIFATHKGLLSINDLLEEEGIELNFRDDSWQTLMLKKSLLQAHCSTTLRLHKLLFYKKEKELQVDFDLNLLVTPKKSKINDDLEYFRPLSFVKFEVDEDVFSYEYKQNAHTDRYLNIEHPLSKWLIRVQKLMFEQYNIHYRIILDAWGYKTINSTLDKLRILMPLELRPSDDIVLIEKNIIKL